MSTTHSTTSIERSATLVLCGALTVLAQSVGGQTLPRGDSPAAPRQRELIQLVRQDCGSCHGMKLSGGLGPSLRREDLERWTVKALSDVIIQGRAGTAMPGWRGLLSEDETYWIAQQLKLGFPDAR